MPKKIKPKTFAQFLGSAINSAMADKGYTQEEMSEGTGIPLSTIGRRLRGTHPLLVVELLKIAAYLEVPATRIVDQALENYGGLAKLLSEGDTNNVVAFPTAITDFDEYVGDRAASTFDEEATTPEG